MERIETTKRITRMLALDFNCTENDLTSGAITFAEAMPLEGRRRFPIRPYNFATVTMGQGAVVTCDACRLQQAKACFSGLDRDGLYSAEGICALTSFLREDGQRLAGPDLKYVCSTSTFRGKDTPGGISIEMFQGDRVRVLYEFPGFGNALQYRTDSQRPDVIACVARRSDAVVGIAGASADCEAFWQVGVDVTREFRNQGIGRAVVAAATQAVFDAGRIPYYSTVSSNVRSQSLAVSVGYWPAWVEMYAR